MRKHLIALWLVIALLGFDRLMPDLIAQPQKPPIPANNGPTTSTQLASIITDETGTGPLVFGNEPTIDLKAFSEKPVPVAITGGAVNFDLTAGTVFTVTSNANISTFHVTGWAASRSKAFTVVFTGNGTSYTQNFAPCRFAGAINPSLTGTNGQIDVLTGFSFDGGVTLLCFVGGQNF